MVERVGNEVHWDPLIAIASEELGINYLTESGKVTTDIRLVRISSLAKALERAYDFGLLMGHSVSRAEHVKTKRSKLTCRAEQDLVRAAANDILSTYLS
ncbi:DUF6900 domain-containing protein [Paraburkholderia sp. MM6662-R1]|uniref:DUF6900 domain-containing protein n=1 Tax=Paraburkholderia sp. MM6662-R1 TaxID=2991066 RepID=UPI003D23CAB8